MGQCIKSGFKPPSGGHLTTADFSKMRKNEPDSIVLTSFLVHTPQHGSHVIEHCCLQNGMVSGLLTGYNEDKKDMCGEEAVYRPVLKFLKIQNLILILVTSLVQS